MFNNNICINKMHMYVSVDTYINGHNSSSTLFSNPFISFGHESPFLKYQIYIEKVVLFCTGDMYHHVVFLFNSSVDIIQILETTIFFAKYYQQSKK